MWIIPVAYYGLTDTKAPWLPEILARRTNVSRLFSSENPTWAIYAIQVKSSPSEEFVEIREADFFKMRPFGYRTRFQRLFSMADEKSRTALAEWLSERLKENGSAIFALRFVSFPYHAILQDPSGRYQQPPLDSAKGSFQILGEYQFAQPDNQ